MLRHYLEKEKSALNKYVNKNINANNITLELSQDSKVYIYGLNTKLGPYDDIMIFKDLTLSTFADRTQPDVYVAVQHPDSHKWSISQVSLNLKDQKLTHRELYSSQFPIVPLSYVYVHGQQSRLFFYETNLSLEWELKELNLDNMKTNTVLVLPPQAENIIQLIKRRYDNLAIMRPQNIVDEKTEKNTDLSAMICQYDNVLEVYVPEANTNPPVFLELAKTTLPLYKRSVYPTEASIGSKDKQPEVSVVSVEYIISKYKIPKNSFSKKELAMLENNKINSVRLLSISYSSMNNKLRCYIDYDDPYLKTTLLHSRNAPVFMLMNEQINDKTTQEEVVKMIKTIIYRHSGMAGNEAVPSSKVDNHSLTL